MKRCLTCNQVYDDEPIYCDMDGTLLVSLSILQPSGRVLKGRIASTKSIAVSVAIGIALAIAAFAIFYVFMQQPEPQTPNELTVQPASDTTRAASIQREESPPPAGSREIPEITALRGMQPPTATPSPESSSVPSPTPNSRVPSTGNDANRSTPAPTPDADSNKGRTNRVLTRILFTDGSVIEVDDVWRDAQGVWYKRGGMVTLIKDRRLKAIERHPVQEQPQTEESTPTLTPTPNANPTP